MPLHLAEVTWSLVKYEGDKPDFFRGYYAALIFKGDGFEKGVTWAHFRPSEVAETPFSDHWQPSGREYILTPSYFEVSTGDAPEEAPLSWRGYQFAVKNPNGEVSNWVEFSYSFDNAALLRTLDAAEAAGRALIAAHNYQEAIEPCRKAMVYADRLFGVDNERTANLRQIWNQALDRSVLVQLTSKIGDKVELVGGEHDGRFGVVTDIHARHYRPYGITLDDGTQTRSRANEVVSA